MGIPEKIKQIEEDLHRTQVNKKTERHIGLLRAKLAKLKRELEESRTRGGASSVGFDVKKSNDATVVLIGLPNVGKSTLLNKLTNSKSKVASYSFTTVNVIPGVMSYRGASIQILDLPGIVEGASTGKGRGKKVLAVARSADLILFVLDVTQPNVLPLLVKEMRDAGIRLDENPPNIVIETTNGGGISVNTVVKMTKMSVDLVQDLLRVYDIHNARVTIREDITDNQLIDVLLGNRIYVSTLTVLNKIDLVKPEFLTEIKSSLTHDFVPISCEENMNIKALKEHLYQKLGFIRIYLRPKSGETDYFEPMIIKTGALILDVCNKIHRNLKNEIKYAQIWGKSAKFGGQKVGLTHKLVDEDVLTFITKSSHETSIISKVSTRMN